MHKYQTQEHPFRYIKSVNTFVIEVPTVLTELFRKFILGKLPTVLVALSLKFSWQMYHNRIGDFEISDRKSASIPVALESCRRGL